MIEIFANKWLPHISSFSGIDLALLWDLPDLLGIC